MIVDEVRLGVVSFLLRVFALRNLFGRRRRRRRRLRLMAVPDDGAQTVQIIEWKQGSTLLLLHWCRCRRWRRLAPIRRLTSVAITFHCATTR